MEHTHTQEERERERDRGRLKQICIKTEGHRYEEIEYSKH
jgi:hypothetical protein